ncbi:methyltransferase RsmF C-terminal domain-like protein [Flectobacillus sp. BAB-3569]|uniref:methyltransferase RsmF C-terminal domain-like protein n=1 Tax=Flectobacillus sp. BAB-3569 TaxID=1509483 RepID=UPI001C3CDA25|nr:RsmB/NOP family class I SAM-dependent RNA methyltransferase [Flectobacillus sp. BAB-3569]
MSLPQALLDSLSQVTGYQADSFIKTHELGESPTSIRINPDKINTPPAHLNIQSPVLWNQYGYYLNARPAFTFDPYFHAGTYYVQEASSMFLEYAVKQSVDLDEDLRVLDLCAAPGGKSTLLASLLSPDSLLVSNEVIKSRANILVDNMSKWGLTNTYVTNNDPKDFSRIGGYFDLIVVDAPCSGSGLFRRDPEAVVEWSLDNVAMCSQRQQRILADVWDSLKEGGILLYSTCSYSEAENETIMDWVVDNLSAKNIVLDKKDTDTIQQWGIVRTESPEHKAIGYRFYPDQAKGEGFFMAAFQKTKSDYKPFHRPHIKPQRTKSFKHEKSVLSQWITDLENYMWFEKNDNFYLINPEHESDLKILQSNLYIKKAGILLGQIGAKDLIPEHELALSTILSEQVPILNVSYEQAIAYLRKDDFVPDTNQRGWCGIAYEEHILGWGKALGNRFNNYYPKELRILSRLP